MRNQKTGATAPAPENRVPGARTAEAHESILWSGLSVDEARDLADDRHEPDLPRIASALRVGQGREERSPVDAREYSPTIEYAQRYAYELEGRRLQAQVVGDLLGALARSVGSLARRFVFDPIRRWNDLSQRLRELRQLDDRMLKDIGVNRSEIAYVAQWGDDSHARAA